MTIRDLTRKYKKAGTYAEMVREIIAHNTEKVARGLGRVSEARYRRAADRALGRGVLTLPRWDEVVPARAVWLRKSYESGELISETLRTRLTAGLREELVAWRGETGAAPGRVPPELLRRLEARVSSVMYVYSSPTPDGGRPAQARAIAVTEARSAVDEVKYQYARRVADAGRGKVELFKRWVHNDSLVRKPRPGHKAMDGATVPLDGTFSVPTPSGAVSMLHPHDPSAPAGEVIGCQCDYDVIVVPAAVAKAAAAIESEVEKARKPSTIKVGDRVTRPDGSVWEKTGTFSYKKVSDAGGTPAPEGKDEASGDPVEVVMLERATSRSVKRILSMATYYGRDPDDKETALVIGAIDSSGLPEEAKAKVWDHWMGASTGGLSWSEAKGGRGGDKPAGESLSDDVAGLIADLSKPGGLTVEESSRRKAEIRRKYDLTGEELTEVITDALSGRPVAAPSKDAPAEVVPGVDVAEVKSLAASMSVPMDVALRAHEGRGLPVGTRRIWGGVEWVKTSDGWKRVKFATARTFEAAMAEVGVDDPEIARAHKEFLDGTSGMSPGELLEATEELRDKYEAAGLELTGGVMDAAREALGAGEPGPEDLLRADPAYMEYFLSSDDSEAGRRLELKKELGKKYGVDPFKVVEMKAADKEREAASGVVAADEYGSSVDLSEMGPVSLKRALERDGLVADLVRDLKVDSVSDLTTEEIRKWMSTRYSLSPKPIEASTPASKRLMDLYASDPSARLIPRPGASTAPEIEVEVDDRPWWTPKFKEKLTAVLNNNRPKVPLDALTSAPHVIKAFAGSPASARKFVNDVDSFVRDHPITMRFHIKDVARHWAKEPRTKNLFETGTGHGSTSKPARSRWEHRIINFADTDAGALAHGEMLPSERPSYAMIGSKRSFAAGAGSGYGDSTLVLKDEVKARCTFTLGNSSGEIGAFTAGGASRLLEKDRSSMLYSNRSYKARCVDETYTYLEAQVWGGVDISKDVSHIVVSGREWERSTPEDQANMKAVADRCGVEIRYRDGEVLYSPRSGAKMETTGSDVAKIKAALAVPIGTIKKDMGPEGKVYKIKTSKFTWALCDESGRRLGGPPTTAPSRWAVTWHAVKPEEMSPDPAPASAKPGSAGTYTKGGKVYIKHDPGVPVGGTEVRPDGSRYLRTSKFTWRKL